MNSALFINLNKPIIVNVAMAFTLIVYAVDFSARFFLLVVNDCADIPNMKGYQEEFKYKHCGIFQVINETDSLMDNSVFFNSSMIDDLDEMLFVNETVNDEYPVNNIIKKKDGGSCKFDIPTIRIMLFSTIVLETIKIIFGFHKILMKGMNQRAIEPVTHQIQQENDTGESLCSFTTVGCSGRRNSSLGSPYKKAPAKRQTNLFNSDDPNIMELKDQGTGKLQRISNDISCNGNLNSELKLKVNELSMENEPRQSKKLKHVTSTKDEDLIGSPYYQISFHPDTDKLYLHESHNGITMTLQDNTISSFDDEVYSDIDSNQENYSDSDSYKNNLGEESETHSSQEHELRSYSSPNIDSEERTSVELSNSMLNRNDSFPPCSLNAPDKDLYTVSNTFKNQCFLDNGDEESYLYEIGVLAGTPHTKIYLSKSIENYSRHLTEIRKKSQEGKIQMNLNNSSNQNGDKPLRSRHSNKVINCNKEKEIHGLTKSNNTTKTNSSIFNGIPIKKGVTTDIDIEQMISIESVEYHKPLDTQRKDNLMIISDVISRNIDNEIRSFVVNKNEVVGKPWHVTIANLNQSFQITKKAIAETMKQIIIRTSTLSLLFSVALLVSLFSYNRESAFVILLLKRLGVYFFPLFWLQMNDKVLSYVQINLKKFYRFCIGLS